MKKKLQILFSIIFLSNSLFAQLSSLKIEDIMRGDRWTGISPTEIFWSEDSKEIYFEWNPDFNPGDSLYAYNLADKSIKKLSPEERIKLPAKDGSYNRNKSKKVYVKNGDLFLLEVSTMQMNQITKSLGSISNPKFTYDEKGVTFTMNDNLYLWEISNGRIGKLTDFKSGNKEPDNINNEFKKWLEQDELNLIGILKARKNNKEQAEKINKANSPKKPFTIYTGKKSVQNIQRSAGGNYIVYTLFEQGEGENTDVPNYVTNDGFTENLTARFKVGNSTPTREVWIYNVPLDSTYMISTTTLPGIEDTPDFYADYPKYENLKPTKREVYSFGPFFSGDGKKAVAIFRSKDNKDRWICLLDLSDGSVKSLERQRNEAWVAGPGIGTWTGFLAGDIGWLNDNETIWFQSEETGYSHLYTINTSSGKKKALTKGKYEIYDPILNKDYSSWYFTANIDHPGDKQIYKMDVKGGKFTKLTADEGAHEFTLSQDEAHIAIRYSSSNQPWEIFLMQNQSGVKMQRITNSTTEAFNDYSWKKPENISFKARDGEEVYARLYQPAAPQPNGPAIIFVHGAGYLHNAHKWWSSYYREYMFHNFLVDNGYTVLDIDYRGSAGYGSKWRTAIYRNMGGKDLEDNIDGAKYLVDQLNMDPERIGIYGGSYGGFITLMALFKNPGVFSAGAALRSVTDWSHYNHPYTSNILNTPVEDSLAYRRSSPIYYAAGLQDPLLMCHGVIDTNVQFQDVVRLSQIFIELGKEDWEMAIYPLESHGFVEPSSWTDEYKRIFKLFEKHLK